MEELKPWQVLLFLCIALILLAGISAIVPEQGIDIGKGYKITFAHFDDLLPAKEERYADISSIIGEHAQDSVPENYIETVQLNFEAETDSISEDSIVEAIVIDTVRADAKKLRKKTSPIEFPGNDHTILYTFFDKLANVSKASKPLRILHYGDSQIEGDRISAVVRQHFQEEYGGMGPGWMAAYEDQGFAGQMLLEHEGYWERYARFAKKDSLIEHARFGPLASFSRFSPLFPEAEDSSKIYESSIKISGKEQWLYPLRNKFRKIDIYFGSHSEPVFVEIYHKDSLIHMQGLDSTSSVQQLSWESTEPLQECTIAFAGKESPDIYGLCLDDTAGIALDNISMRGSSGLEFTRISKSHLSHIFDYQDIGLIILQFGVNIVPIIRDDYSFYEKKLSRQIKRIHELFPNTPVLLVGVTDMSRKEGNYYESYPNIELIRDAQKRVAFENDCAFWDIYKAMGGKNSMPSWVFAKPALAQKDFTHFNYKGAKIIGQMFYNALINEFDGYQAMLSMEISTEEISEEGIK